MIRPGNGRADTVGKVVVLETESGSLPCTPAPRRQRAPAPAVFRNDTRHSAREEPSQSASYSGGSAVSDASARSTSSAAPSMADILLVVKRAGGGENITVRSTTRDVAVEIEVRWCSPAPCGRGASLVSPTPLALNSTRSFSVCSALW